MPETPPKAPINYPYLRHFPDVPVDLASKETDPNLAETGNGRNKIRLNAVTALRRYQFDKDNRQDLDILYAMIQECTRAEIGVPEPETGVVLERKESARQLADFLNLFLKDYRIDEEGNPDRDGKLLRPPIFEIPLDPKIRQGRNQIRERAMAWLDANPQPAKDDPLYSVIVLRREFIGKFLDLSIKAETGALYKLKEDEIIKRLGLDDEEGKAEILNELGLDSNTKFVLVNPTQKQREVFVRAITGALLMHVDDVKEAEKNFSKKENRDVILKAARDWLDKYPENRITKKLRKSINNKIEILETLESGRETDKDQKLIEASKNLYSALEVGKGILNEAFGSGSARNHFRAEVLRWLNKNPAIKLKDNGELMASRNTIQELFNLSVLAETGKLYEFNNTPESRAKLKAKHGISKELLESLSVELPNPSGDNMVEYTPFVKKYNNIKIGNALRSAIDFVLTKQGAAPETVPTDFSAIEEEEPADKSEPGGEKIVDTDDNPAFDI